MNAPASSASFRNSVLLAGGVAVLGCGLRLAYLDAGLRHEPHYDEQVFVEEVQWMIQREDWVPRFFEYPGFLFWILRVAFTLTGAQGAGAYLVARMVIVAFSVAAVFGVAFLGSRWFSPSAGALSGLLLALSPLSVETAHSVRLDEAIGAVILAALATGAPLVGEPRRVLGWCLAAAAVSIKFSAALVFPALLLSAVLDRVPMARIARLAFFALLTFFVLSPWTILGGFESARGMTTQVEYHYSGGPGFLPSLVAHLAYTLPVAISWPGLGLAFVGLLVFARSSEGRSWIAFVVLWILVFSSTDRPFLRFMVPILGVLSLAAGAGFAEFLRRLQGPARLSVWVWAFGALAVSAGTTLQYLEETGRPSTEDRALDWIETGQNLARVATVERGLGRYSDAAVEIVHLTGKDERNDLLLRQFDALILDATSPFPPGFLEAARFKPASPRGGRELVAIVPLSPPKLSTQSLAGAILITSAPDRESKLIDGDVGTRWRADSTPAFIDITVPVPARLARVELAYGGNSPERRQVTRLLVDGREVDFVEVRGPISRQRSGGYSDLLAFDSPPARTVRIEFNGNPPFIVGELGLYSHAAQP